MINLDFVNFSSRQVLFDSAAENTSFCAVERIEPRQLKSDKLKDLTRMYTKFIPKERKLELLLADCQECNEHPEGIDVDARPNDADETDNSDDEYLYDALWQVTQSTSVSTSSNVKGNSGKSHALSSVQDSRTETFSTQSFYGKKK